MSAHDRLEQARVLSALRADPAVCRSVARTLVAARVATRVTLDAARRRDLAPHAARWRARADREVAALSRILDRAGAGIGARITVRSAAIPPNGTGADILDLFAPVALVLDGHGMLCVLSGLLDAEVRA